MRAREYLARWFAGLPDCTEAFWASFVGKDRYHAEADRFIAALRAAGYELVPVEASDPMIDAGIAAAESYNIRESASNIWFAMISAAKEQT